MLKKVLQRVNVIANEALLRDQPFDETFDYRVRAVNEAGEGPPSKSTQVKIHEPEGERILLP